MADILSASENRCQFQKRSACAWQFCCTTPKPTSGTGNITNEPGFVDLANGNLRLQSNSPCINAGYNSLANGSPDLDGRPRIVGAKVDIGAYEYQGPGRSKFIGWLRSFGLRTDGTDDFTDPDTDHANNWQEWRCGTDPTNALSALRLLAPQRVGSDLLLQWESVAGVAYCLERSAELSAAPVFLPVATTLPAPTGMTFVTDTNAAIASPWFYRLNVLP
jgi:hypothetical protein